MPNRNKAIVITYIPIQRKYYSDAKMSKLTIQQEVDRMGRLSNRSDLPKSKLSRRDAYLFKLSSRATKKEECRRRSNRREKAYKKQCIFVPRYEQHHWHLRYPKMKSTDRYGCGRYTPSRAIPITNRKKKSKGSIAAGQTKSKKKPKKPKKKVIR